MKNPLFIFVFSVLFPVHPSFSQFAYSWKSSAISVKSDIELQSTESPNGFHLEGGGIYIDFATLGGMEGITGLAPSLDSYAESFGYKFNGKARLIWDVQSMNVARIDGKKYGQNLTLCLLASKDFKKHFTCEILFPESQQANVEAIIKGISCSEGNIESNQEKAVENQPINEVEKQNADQPQQEQQSGFDVGTLAPDFTLNNASGNPIKLSTYRGKTVLLDFWGTWCGPCIQSIPKLKELYTKYGGSGFEIISIANDVDANKWKNMVTEKEMNWTNVIDPNEKVCNLYQIKAYPSLYLIDKNGKFVTQRTSDAEVEEFLKQNGQIVSKPVQQEPQTYRQQQQQTVNQPGMEGVTNNHLTGTPVQLLTWQLLSNYSPDGYFILDEFYKTPTDYGGQSQSGNDDFTEWIDGQSEQDIIKSLNTVVHEMDHGFNGRVYFKILKEANQPLESGGYSSFYLGNKETKVVKHTEVYVSKEINAVFPANLITSRYETYVYPSEPIMGSQQEGVYGLLDEWNAYYNGTKTSFDLYNYYKEKRNDASGWAEYFTDYYGTYYAYLEFKSYILVYMMHAKNNYPQMYQGFMNNQDLLYSLQKTDEIWKGMIENFKRLKKTIITDLTSRGIDVEEKDGFLFMDGSGNGNFSEIYNTFQEELKKPDYQEISSALGFASAGGPDF